MTILKALLALKALMLSAQLHASGSFLPPPPPAPPEIDCSLDENKNADECKN